MAANFLRLPHGIPSYDTFERVFAMLDPQAFHHYFVASVRSLCEDPAPGGGREGSHRRQTARRSLDKANLKAALHLVSAWADGACLSLGQVAIDDKCNEITAIPKLLKIVDIRGATVAIDATPGVGRHSEIAPQIVDQEGDTCWR